MALAVVYWGAVLATSLVLVAALLLVLEGRDASGLRDPGASAGGPPSALV